MNEKKALVVAKVALGPWQREVTTELGIAFSLALEPFDYDEALTAVAKLIQQPDRQFPPNPGEIVGAIKATTNSLNPSRKYFTAKDAEPEQGTPIERRREIVAAARAARPEVFEVRSSSKDEQRGFDEGCSD